MAGPENTRKKQGGAPPFKPGESGNPAGRPKGSRNKLGEEFVQALHADFSEYGVEAIERVRTEDPTAYVKTIASLLPKEVKIENAGLTELSDDELTRLIDIVRATVGPSDEVGSGEKAPRKPKPPSSVPTLQ